MRSGTLDGKRTKLSNQIIITEMQAMSYFVRTLVMLGFFCSSLLSMDIEAQAGSPVWQVRYCLVLRFEVADAMSRRLLEKLVSDPHRSVAYQAFAKYSGLFVDLDRSLISRAFQRGDFDLAGVDVSDRKVFESPEFWMFQLKQTEAPDIQARAIRALGMCGTKQHLDAMAKYRSATEPYVLSELAMAFRRLGDDEAYLAVVHSVLELNPEKAGGYQTLAIDCLIQTHPAMARAEWSKLHAKVERLPDLQPNWMCAHVLQAARLP